MRTHQICKEKTREKNSNARRDNSESNPNKRKDYVKEESAWEKSWIGEKG